MTDHATADPTDSRSPVATPGTDRPTHDHDGSRPTGLVFGEETTAGHRPAGRTTGTGPNRATNRSERTQPTRPTGQLGPTAGGTNQ